MRNKITIKFSILALLCSLVVALCILHNFGHNRATVTTNVIPHNLHSISPTGSPPNHYATAPKILGVDNNHRYYNIVADYVIQENGIVFMHNVQANIPVNDNIMAIINAKYGKILTNTHKALLYSTTLGDNKKENSEPVSVKLGNYGILQAEFIEVLYEEGKMLGKNKVQLNTELGSLSGDNFIIDNTENTIKVNGHAYATIQLLHNKMPPRSLENFP